MVANHAKAKLCLVKEYYIYSEMFGKQLFPDAFLPLQETLWTGGNDEPGKNISKMRNAL